MKHIVSSLVFVGLTLAALAQPTATKEQATAIYTIQLGIFENNIVQADFEAVRSYAYIYKRDGVVFVGGFATEEAAEPILAKLKAKGYDDAFIAARSLKKGKTVHVIQIATKNAGEPLNWRNYARTGQIYTMPNGTQVRIAHGWYDDINEARVKLKEIQAMGFEDAFVRTVKDVQLNPVTIFDTGDNAIAFKSPKSETDVKQPTSYNTVPAAKRKSVMKLQEALKEEGLYTGTIDGIIGKGTAGAYDRAVKSNRRLRSFNELAQKYDGYEGFEDVRLLVTIAHEMSINDNVAPITADLINNLPNDPLSMKDQTTVLDWHTATFKSLEKWSALSQYNDQMYNAFKIAYYQALTHLEDHYILQGFKNDMATALAVSVIKTLIADDLAGFN